MCVYVTACFLLCIVFYLWPQWQLWERALIISDHASVSSFRLLRELPNWWRGTSSWQNPARKETFLQGPASRRGGNSCSGQEEFTEEAEGERVWEENGKSLPVQLCLSQPNLNCSVGSKCHIKRNENRILGVIETDVEVVLFPYFRKFNKSSKN